LAASHEVESLVSEILSIGQSQYFTGKDHRILPPMAEERVQRRLEVPVGGAITVLGEVVLSDLLEPLLHLPVEWPSGLWRMKERGVAGNLVPGVSS
jgi:hypothetical protein